MNMKLMWAIATLASTAPIHAQVIIVDDYYARQAYRDARRQPYLPNDHGSIASAQEAADACSEKALYQAGPASKLTGPAHASTMSTGWEVEGMIAAADGEIPFVCSVRNGLVSGLMLRK